MQATASSFFLPIPLFPVAFFLFPSKPIFQSFISMPLYRALSGSQIIYIKRLKGFSAPIKGEYWLRVAHNRQVAIVSSLWKLSCFYICSAWLMWWKTAESHLKSSFSTFPAALPWPCSQHLFAWKIYLVTTLAEDLGNPSTAVLTIWQKLTRSWWFNLKG